MPTDLIHFAIVFVIYLLVLGLIYWVLMQVVGAIPEPPRTVASVVVKVIFLLILLYMVLQLLPPMPRLHS